MIDIEKKALENWLNKYFDNNPRIYDEYANYYYRDEVTGKFYFYFVSDPETGIWDKEEVDAMDIFNIR